MDTKELEKNCDATLQHLKKDLQKMRGSRASTGMLEDIMVECYGTQTPIKQLGLLNTPESRLITLQLYDASTVEAVEKAILQSDVGLNPSRDGSLLRMAVPALTDERKKELAKLVNKLGEDAKIALRSHRKDANDTIKKLEKDKEISEDEMRKAQDAVQEVINSATKEVEVLIKEKEEALKQV